MNSTTETTQFPASLDEVIGQYLQAEKKPPPSEYLQRFPQWTTELRAFFDDQKCFNVFAAPLRDAISQQSSLSSGAVVGKYHIESELGRGGMGVIFRAHHEDLPRPVALKMLRAGTLADDVDKQRFRFETEAVARLDHPNIVQIYDVGEHEQQPYFTMKIIDGGSLAKRLEQWRMAPDNAAQSKTQQQRIAQLMIQVCRAVHYAHSRGILHRDLKPANILLDETGHPFVSDFGLAKLLHNEAGAPVTQTGSILGTPSYMAPEQATGKTETVSVASDVYSLGAILYELLAGRPPFCGEGPWDVLQQVTNSEAEPIRKIHPNVDADLETICLKCLNKDPHRRYTGADELANDLQRFTDGMPIHARPVGRWERLKRWRRRKPMTALAAGLGLLLLLLLLIGGVTFGVMQHNHLQRMKEAARDLANQQSATRTALVSADRSFWLAHKAVQEFCVQAARELQRDAKLHPIRKKFLNRAMEYYRTFLKQRGDDKNLQHELAEAYNQIGQITTIIGPRSEALTAYQKALAIYERLHKKSPHDPDAQYRYALAHLNVATQQQALGHSKASYASFRHAQSLFEIYRKHTPMQPRLINGAARTANNLAVWHANRGDLLEAIKAHRLAINLRKKLVAAHSKNLSYHGELALAFNNLGVCLAQNGRLKDALIEFKRARDTRKLIVSKKQNDPYAHVALAASYRDIGMVQMQLDNASAGVAAWKVALDIRKRMADDHPNITLFQADLAGIYQDMAVVYRTKREYAKTVDFYAKAIGIWRRLMKTDTEVPFYPHAYAKCDSRIGEILRIVGQLKDAERCFKRASELQSKIVKKYPTRLEYRYELGETLQRWGELELRKKNGTEASVLLEKSEDVLNIAIAQSPVTANYRIAKYHTLRLLSRAYRMAGGFWNATETAKRRHLLCNSDPQKLYFVAQDFAISAHILLKHHPRPGPTEIAQRDQMHAYALSVLEEAIARGYKDIDALHRDAAMAGIRQLPRYDEIVRGAVP